MDTNTKIFDLSVLGNNLELAEGLCDAFKITKNIKYMNFASRIIKGCLKNYRNSDYTLGLLQLYNILRINDLPIENELQSIFDNINGDYKSHEGLPSFKNAGNQNIFSQIYLFRCLIPV